MLKVCRNITLIALVLNVLVFISVLMSGKLEKTQIICLIVGILCFCGCQYLYKTKNTKNQ
mgnify:CR=1 FL=1|jgi:hypothetical protein